MGRDRIDLAESRDRWRTLVNAEKEPSRSVKCGEILTGYELVSCSRRIMFHRVMSVDSTVRRTAHSMLSRLVSASTEAQR
jgi:hypothetical protein